LDQNQAHGLERAVDSFLITHFAGRSERDVRHSDAERQLLAAREIARQARTGRTHYLILRSPEEAGDAARLREVARILRARYPGLMCIELSTKFDHRLKEYDRFRPFLDLLPKR
jgi:hypothetical protein